MAFLACGGCVKDLFVTEEELINKFTGQQLWLWGSSAYGRLGDGTAFGACKSSPVQTVSGGTDWRSVSLGDSHSAATKTDGTLWLWGYGSFGRLGTNASFTSFCSPVQTVSGGNNWRSVSLGRTHSAAIKTDGTLWLWGDALRGALGNNAVIDRSSPVQTVSGGTNWRSVSLGSNFSAATKTDGTLWLWGDGSNGALGNNAVINRSSPVQTVSGGTNWRSVSLGPIHSAAIKTDGTLWLWGFNAVGKLGDNTIINKSSPVQTVSGGTNWRSVSLDGQQSAAIKTDGTLWLWGDGRYGKLGGNAVINRSSPVQTVSGGTNWRSVSLGSQHSAAIKTDGTLWLWGNGQDFGGFGRLGDNTGIGRSSPVQTVSRGTDWRSVSLGFSHSAATCVTEYVAVPLPPPPPSGGGGSN
jgi:alpha-tubulin suppressor-like RCC1 family protein